MARSKKQPKGSQYKKLTPREHAVFDAMAALDNLAMLTKDPYELGKVNAVRLLVEHLVGLVAA